MNEVFIVGARRTPIGSFGGAFATTSAPRLGAAALAAALEQAGVPKDKVEQAYLGCVLQAAIGQAPARQAVIYAGLPKACGAVTVNKVCGSGMKSVMLAANDIRSGEFEVVAAGGMENMSLVPYYLTGARHGYRMGHGEVTDGMIHDGLWDPYHNKHMGNCGDLCASTLKFTREEQDAFALESYRRAAGAWADGSFAREVSPVLLPQKKGDPVRVEKDEEPFRLKADKVASLKPAFGADGTVTAANASKINDGAAALVLASGPAVKALGLKPLARVVAQASHAQEPEWFSTAPIEAAKKALARAGLKLADIDLFEVNEAFAVVAMAFVRELGLDPAVVNPYGGAVALGHPIGASGARILVTLLNALQAKGKSRGLAAICIGGGEATAMIVERV
jgi:acetyl-CoA C-acetyltransferase